MVQLFLGDVRRLHDGTEVLSVGAGNERILYWLADRVGRVVATDIYGDGAFASREAELSMLEDPASHAPWPYREDHLEVAGWMAAGSTFPMPRSTPCSPSRRSSTSGAEGRGRGRFGDRAGAATRGARPIDHRVPGPAPSAELRAGRCRAAARHARAQASHCDAAPPGRAGRDLHPRELHKRIVEPSGLRMLQPLDLSLSPESWATAGNTTYPMIVVQISLSLFTSVCLALEKPGPAR